MRISPIAAADQSTSRCRDPWYAVYTQPHAEPKALENLLRQGYAAYLPRYRTKISHARRRQTVLRPLFPRYLFAGIDRATMPWRPILSTVGVTDVVRAGDEPTPVPPEIVTAIREREDTRAASTGSIADRLLRLGELVRVTTGAFEDMVGRLVELRDQDRVVVLLELLGRTVRAQIRAGVGRSRLTSAGHRRREAVAARALVQFARVTFRHPNCGSMGEEHCQWTH